MKYFKTFILISCLSLLASFIAPITASATPSLSTLGECGTSESQFAVTTEDLPPSGSFYIKLSNVQETPSPVSLYFQSIVSGQCQLIGTATAHYGQWTAVGKLTNIPASGGFLIASGSGLGAYPYSSVLTTLIVTNSSICQPTTSCNVNYLGYSAVLEPTILSHSTDQVAIYEVKPVSGVGYSKVSYYDNGNYLYGGRQLKPINRNYLDGGIHNIDIQLSLKNGQTLDIYQKINMGNDVTGMLYIKSRIYQSKSKALLLGLACAIVIIIVLLLVIIRLVYKRHRFVVDHGLNKLPDQMPQVASDDQPVIGKF